MTGHPMKTTRTIILTAYISALFLFISSSAILQAAVEKSAKREVDIENLKHALNKWLPTRFASALDTD